MTNLLTISDAGSTFFSLIGVDFLNTLYKTRNVWKQTSYNTIGGEHTLGGTPFRKNYAGIGFKYDQTRDAFIPPKPYDSWTCLLYTSPSPRD